MPTVPTVARFFLGANTPVGFVGYLDDLYSPQEGWQAYIIKSGPGTGKGSLMRAVLTAMTERGIDVEEIRCSSDPGSLDGVRVPSMKACIFDGTAPQEDVSYTQNVCFEWDDLSRNFGRPKSTRQDIIPPRAAVRWVWMCITYSRSSAVCTS